MDREGRLIGGRVGNERIPDLIPGRGPEGLDFGPDEDQEPLEAGLEDLTEDEVLELDRLAVEEFGAPVEGEVEHQEVFEDDALADVDDEEGGAP